MFARGRPECTGKWFVVSFYMERSPFYEVPEVLDREVDCQEFPIKGAILLLIWF